MNTGLKPLRYYHNDWSLFISPSTQIDIHAHISSWWTFTGFPGTRMHIHEDAPPPCTHSPTICFIIYVCYNDRYQNKSNTILCSQNPPLNFPVVLSWFVSSIGEILGLLLMLMREAWGHCHILSYSVANTWRKYYLGGFVPLSMPLSSSRPTLTRQISKLISKEIPKIFLSFLISLYPLFLNLILEPHYYLSSKLLVYLWFSGYFVYLLAFSCCCVSHFVLPAKVFLRFCYISLIAISFWDFWINHFWVVILLRNFQSLPNILNTSQSFFLLIQDFYIF